MKTLAHSALPAETIEALVEEPDPDSSPSDYSIVIVDNVVRTNTGRQARLEELAAW